MRETRGNTQAITEHIHTETVRLGLMSHKWRTQVDEGSPTYGRAWRIAAVCPKTGAHYNHPATGAGGDYLGFSRREANMSLRRIMRGLDFMHMTKKEARKRYGRK
jgi:hypothetical protein